MNSRKPLVQTAHDEAHPSLEISYESCKSITVSVVVTFLDPHQDVAFCKILHEAENRI